jgi:hypothetical protein
VAILFAGVGLAVDDEVIDRIGENAANRLWTPALLGLVCGFSGFARSVWFRVGRFSRAVVLALTVGVGLMLVGNATEYWVLYRLPHEGAAGIWRALAWMTVLLGALVVLLALPLLGYSLLRSPLPKWLGWVLLVATPVAVAVGATGSRLASLPVAAVGAAGTVKLQVQFPEESPVSSASIKPVAGWSAQIERRWPRR